MSDGNKMSPEEHADIVRTQPEMYFTAVHDRGMEYFKQMLDQQKGKFNNALDGIFKLLSLHSEELSIFRALEVDTRNGTLTDEKLAAYMGRLAAFRERMQLEQEALSRQQEGKTA